MGLKLTLIWFWGWTDYHGHEHYSNPSWIIGLHYEERTRGPGYEPLRSGWHFWRKVDSHTRHRVWIPGFLMMVQNFRG